MVQLSIQPGTRFASSSMRPEFYGLETYSPKLNLDLENKKICDIGDLELSIGNTDVVLDEIYEGTKSIVNDDKIPTTLIMNIMNKRWLYKPLERRICMKKISVYLQYYL